MKLLVLANKLPAFRKTGVKHYAEDSTAVFPKLKSISAAGLRICAGKGEQRKSCDCSAKPGASKALQGANRKRNGKERWCGKLGRSAGSFSSKLGDLAMGQVR